MRGDARRLVGRDDVYDRLDRRLARAVDDVLWFSFGFNFKFMKSYSDKEAKPFSMKKMKIQTNFKNQTSHKISIFCDGGTTPCSFWHAPTSDGTGCAAHTFLLVILVITVTEVLIVLVASVVVLVNLS